ncbi:ATP-dependent RNA helicase DDX42 [Smittium culicis]|uniref:ATP-dependent RNA helicase DDX42 n=1 Tax=Smittium culicis TaxID=133412 RepID=A0A1R1Y0J1_9FUNG|nr:ATP-dependent RNA helicase DDX42 [Smittium culicis]
MGFALLFSATFPKKIEYLSKNVTKNASKIVIGHLGDINDDISQEFHSFLSDEQKWDWLSNNLVKYTIGAYLNGDMLQNYRDKAIFDFKKGKVKILVATDVASRGLDIKDVKTVINFEPTRDIDSFIHRVGRTGRGGTKGKAITLLTNGSDLDGSFATKLIKHYKAKSKSRPKSSENSSGPADSSNSDQNILSWLYDYATRNNLRIAPKSKHSILNDPLSNPGLSHMVSGSRLPGNRVGIGGSEQKSDFSSKRKPNVHEQTAMKKSKNSQEHVPFQGIKFTKAVSEQAGANQTQDQNQD